jgi:hypothetical protein
MKTVVRRVCIPAKIRTKHHPNTRQELYRWTNLLPVAVILIQIYFASLKFYLRRRERANLELGKLSSRLLPRNYKVTMRLFGVEPRPVTKPNDQFRSEVI